MTHPTFLDDLLAKTPLLLTAAPGTPPNIAEATAAAALLVLSRVTGAPAPQLWLHLGGSPRRATMAVVEHGLPKVRIEEAVPCPPDALRLRLHTDGTIATARETLPECARALPDHIAEARRCLRSDDPEEVWRADLRSPDERALIEAALSAPPLSSPKETLVSLVLAQARRTPEAAAVWHADDPDGALSYSQLAQLLQNGASALRQRGVRRGAPVALIMDRGPAQVAAALAVMAAGAPFVPIEKTAPPERTALMLGVLASPHLVTDEPASHLPATMPDRARPLLWQDLVTAPAADFEDRSRPDDAAYILFTSGSTGTPKGVLGLQRAAANYLHWVRQEVPAIASKPGLMHSALGFDIFLTHLMAPLAFGGGVAVTRAAGNIEEIAGLLKAPGGFSILHLTPSHLSGLDDVLEENDDVAGGGAAYVVGGEPVIQDVLRRWRKRAPKAQLFNSYGPTEVCCNGLAHRVERLDWPYACPPIGRPKPGTECHVLDAEKCPVPVGVIGELHIGGVGVSLGYYRCPDLTDAAFLPDGSGRPGARMYATGDLVRVLPDGQVLFVGRRDTQVQIRGYRVELGEIEHVLMQRPEVAKAIVTYGAPDGETARPVLAAFLKPTPGARIYHQALREACRTALPEHMIPQRIKRVDSFPLNANGKIDRKALQRSLVRTGDQRPLSRKERAAAQLWSDAIGVPIEHLAVDRSFVENGGDSLAALKVVAHARRLGAPLSARDVTAAQTLCAFVERLDADKGKGMRAPAVRTLDTTHPISLTPSQARLWLIQSRIPDSTAYNEVLTFPAPLGATADAIQGAAQRLHARHPLLRSRIDESESGTPRFHCDVPPPEVQVVRGAIERSLEAFHSQPFDLTQGPLWRALAWRSDDRWMISISIHHVIFDAASAERLEQDFAAALRGDLLEIPVTQIAWPDVPAEEPDAAYIAELTGTPLLLDLGRSSTLRHGAPRLPVFTTAPLAPKAVEGALRDGRALGATPFAILLHAFARALGFVTGAERLAIATPVTERQPEQSDTIGFFANTVLVALDTRTSGILDTQRAVERATDRVAHTFDAVVARLRERLGPGQSRFPQVAFTLHDARGRTGVSRDRSYAGEVKFDLGVEAVITADRAELRVEYDAAVLSAAEFAHLAQLMETALSGGPMEGPAPRVSTPLPVPLSNLLQQMGRESLEEAARVRSALLRAGLANRPVRLPEVTAALFLGTIAAGALPVCSGSRVDAAPQDTPQHTADTPLADIPALPRRACDPESLRHALLQPVDPESRALATEAPQGGLSAVLTWRALWLLDGAIGTFDPGTVRALYVTGALARSPVGAALSLIAELRGYSIAATPMAAAIHIVDTGGMECATGPGAKVLVCAEGWTERPFDLAAQGTETAALVFGADGGPLLYAARIPRGARTYAAFDIAPGLNWRLGKPIAGRACALELGQGRRWWDTGLVAREDRRSRSPQIFAAASDLVVREHLACSGSLAQHPRTAPFWVEAPTGVAPQAAPSARHGSVTETVRDLFAELLPARDVSVETDFFKAGGHSLLAGRLAARLRSVLRADLSVRDIFAHPTPEGLGAQLAARADTAAPEPVLATPEGPVPIAPQQRPLWFLAHLDPESPAYIITRAVWLGRAGLTRASVQRALNRLADIHDVLTCRFTPEGRLDTGVRPCVAVCDGPIDRAGLRRLAREEARRPIAVAAGASCLRSTLYTVGPLCQGLVLTFHHAFVDGLSLGRLLADLESCLLGQVPDGASRVPGFRAYCALADTDGEAERRRAAVIHTARTLEDLPPPHRKDGAAGTGGRVEMRIGPDAWSAARAACEGIGVSSAALVLCATATALVEIEPADDVTLVMPFANRRHAAFATTVGYLINTLPMRLRGLRAQGSLEERLSCCRSALVAAFEGEAAPFDQVVEALRARRPELESDWFPYGLTFLEEGDQEAPTLDWIDPPHNGGAKFNATFEAINRQGGLSLGVEYRHGAVNEEEARRMTERFAQVVADAAALVPGRRSTPRDAHPFCELIETAS